MKNGDGQIRKVPNLKSYEYYVTSRAAVFYFA